MSKNKKVNINTADFMAAVSLAERFDIVAKTATAEETAGQVLAQGINFLDFIASDIMAGSRLDVGNAWGGDELFLDKAKAVQIATQKKKVDSAIGQVAVPLAGKDADKLKRLRNTFNLASGQQTARLAIKAYADLCDGLWRRNSFSMRPPSAKEAQPLDLKSSSKAHSFWLP